MKNNSGQGLMEYIILAILVGVISIAAIKSLGNTVRSKAQTVRSQVNEEVDLDNYD